jgi:hypothetical protein
MIEVFLDEFRIVGLAEQPRRHRVAEVVNPKVGDARPLQGRFVRPP